MAFSDPGINIENLEIHEGSVVADLGAGSGFYAMAAARAVGSGGKVYAVDVQRDLLSRLQNTARTEHLRNIEVIHGDIEKLGGTRLREQSIDVAIAANVLFQVEHKEAFVTEIQRILKPMGRVLVVDWVDSFGGMGPLVDHIVSKEAAQALFEKYKFTLVREIPDAGDHHYSLVYRKS